jgi:hypothetical protein
MQVGKPMSRKGVLALKLDVGDAIVAASTIRFQTADLDLTRTAYAELAPFGRKLRKAITRRRKNPDQVTMWTVTRNEAVAASKFLLLFSREDIPAYFSRNHRALTAVNNVAMDILMTLERPPKGRPPLTSEEIDRRTPSGPSTRDLTDERWIRRLKRRKADNEARRTSDEGFWRKALANYRPRRLSRLEKALLTPHPKSTRV